MSSPTGWHPDPSDPAVQRYWDGSGWTAQRVWNGAQWVATALGAPPPVVAPLAVSPKHRHRGLWIGGGAALAVVVVVVAVAVAAGGSHKGSVAARTSSPAALNSSSDLSAAGSANWRAWENAEVHPGLTNVQNINTVEKDVAAIGKDYSSQADSTTLAVDCNQLSQDLVESTPTDSPDQTVSADLSKAFDYLASGSVDCGVDDQAASSELNKAIDYLNAATSKIKSLGG